MSDMISVFSFKAYSVMTDGNDVRPVKATAEAIRMAKGTLIEGTEEKVEKSRLDSAGIYRPSN